MLEDYWPGPSQIILLKLKALNNEKEARIQYTQQL